MRHPEHPLFQQLLHPHLGPEGLCGRDLATIQVNLGLRCNLACHHCHLGASPHRQEAISWSTLENLLTLVTRSGCRMVDLTGGAPELHPDLHRLVRTLRQKKVAVQLRTNLTLLLEPAQRGVAEFLREQQVALVASLPCYLEENVDAQRGTGVYRQAMAALQHLNHLGYGRTPDLPLLLVYNPGKASLPPPQLLLETAYRQALRPHGIEFTRLLTMTNMPIGRFRAELRRTGEETAYWTLLQQAFNPATLNHLMCRHQVSVGWDGRLYDCDFNLAMGIPISLTATHPLTDLEPDRIARRSIVTGNHCLGCTAGCGSSCGGALAA
ncbi:MAG: arsenosugar biosynthesis radical SAM protein ArsS [Magnetococcus sp. YQC-5]